MARQPAVRLASWLPLTAGLVVMVVYFALPSGSVAHAAVIPVMCAVDAVAAFLATARARGLARVVWVGHAVGLTSLTAGVSILNGYPLVTGHPTPSPSLGDALILGLYPCLAVALWALARLCRGEDHRGDLLDVIIIVAGVGALMWVFALGPSVHMRGLPLPAHMVAVSYAAADLMVFAMLVLLLVGSRRSAAMRLLAASAAMLPLADVALALQMASGVSAFGVVFGGLCLLNTVFMVAAAVHPTARTFTAGSSASTHRLTVPRLVFLGAALLVFPILSVFQPETQSVVQRRHRLEQDLRSALHAKQFRLVYQPIYGLEDLDIAGFEALLRWEHPTLGLVEPAEIIPKLESTGQIVDVGRWVLREACAQMATWRARGHDLIVSVNVSARQLDRDTMVEHVREALAASGLAPSALTLEITETSLMRDLDAVVRRLHQLKALGVQIAIDDFGTGYSSLGYLQRLPVDSIKIDRTFTDAVTRSPESAALIHTLVQLGKELGLKTLAEGVETTTQIDHLRTEDVNEVQGFLLAGPLSAGDIEARLLAP